MRNHKHASGPGFPKTHTALNLSVRPIRQMPAPCRIRVKGDLFGNNCILRKFEKTQNS